MQKTINWRQLNKTQLEKHFDDIPYSGFTVMSYDFFKKGDPKSLINFTQKTKSFKGKDICGNFLRKVKLNEAVFIIGNHI